MKRSKKMPVWLTIIIAIAALLVGGLVVYVWLMWYLSKGLRQ